jgi:hypothetical protein
MEAKNVPEITEDQRERRRSLHKEIEKAAAEIEKTVESKEKIKEYAKNTMFADIQKEVQTREVVREETQTNKNFFSHEVLTKLPAPKD